MNVLKTGLEGLFVLEPQVYVDDRGYFFESFNAEVFKKATGLCVNFIQDNESKSCYGVLRGLHYQLPPFAQSKLVRVVKGKVMDVAVDIRRESPTFCRYESCELSDENHRMVYISAGFAHGFVALSEEVIFQYKCDNLYHPELERAIAWNDPTIGITWPLSHEEIILSEKDRHHPFLFGAELP